jgi:hypothetical protein
MQINLRIDGLDDFADWSLREVKRLAYSTANALNKTAADIQLAERAEIDRTFVVRKNRFMYSLIKITQFARVTDNASGTRFASLYAEVAIDTSKARVLLAELTEGGYKDPAFGKHVAVPVTGSAARPSFSDPVTAALQISRLDFQPHTTKTGKIQWEGRQRTYVVAGVGVFQRSGSSRNDAASDLIYKFITRPRLKKMFDFEGVAERTFAERWDANFRIAYGE